MVWVFDEAKGTWVRKVVFTPEAEWELTGVEEYHLPSTYYNVTPTYNCAVLRVGPPTRAGTTVSARALAGGTVASEAQKTSGTEASGAEMAEASGAAGVLRFERARWGFRGGPGMGHNAKQENLKRVPAWREQWMRHHCVVVADGFYEWDTSAGRKQPYFIHRKDGQPLALAGLYRPPDPAHGMQPGAGEPMVDDRPEATIVTTAANDLVGRLHDRMPVVLEPEAVPAWLQPAAHDEKDLRALCEPAGDVLRMHPVTTDVNKSTNSWPGLVEPVQVAGGTQGKLF